MFDSLFKKSTKVNLLLVLAGLGYSKSFIDLLGSEDKARDRLNAILHAKKINESSLCFQCEEKDFYKGFQIVNSLRWKKISFEFPVSEGFFLKANKTQVLWGNFHEKDCLFVYKRSKPNNIREVSNIEANGDYKFFFNANPTKPLIIENAVKQPFIGLSLTSSIFDGKRGCKGMFVLRKPKEQKQLSDEELQNAIFGNKFDFNHLKSFFEILRNNRSALSNAKIDVNQFLQQTKPVAIVINSMTKWERKNYNQISTSRISRISKGCGMDQKQVSDLISRMITFIESMRNPKIRQEIMQQATKGDMSSWFKSFKS